MMDRRFSGESMKEIKGSSPVALQKIIVESRRQFKAEQSVMDKNFVNGVICGTTNLGKEAYNLSDNGDVDRVGDYEESFDDSVRSNSSRLTEEWLEEARRIIASSPSRSDLPAKFSGSPRFSSFAGRKSSASALDKRDPLSRSARRHRPTGSFGEEILTKLAEHERNNSESLDSMSNSPLESSPASQVHRWFNNMAKLSNNVIADPDLSILNQSNEHFYSSADPAAEVMASRLSTYRKSRFQTESLSPTTPLGIPISSRRTFKPIPSACNQLLSPPRDLMEYTPRRSTSSSTCSATENAISPPMKLAESAHGRSISRLKQEGKDEQNSSLNLFLKEQRVKIEKILNGEIGAKAKVILSASSISTSSMVAAICYSWLMENRLTKNKEQNGKEYVVLPVMNVTRGSMSKHKQATWLFNHIGLDTASLLFVDEVDLDNLAMTRQIKMLVVGEDILRTNEEVGSPCTTLTDNYREHAYNLLQIPVLKSLLLAGILLDTNNLNGLAKMCTTRDAVAVQLLVVGSDSDYRNTFFDQLMQAHKDHSLSEALGWKYEKTSSGSSHRNTATQNLDKQNPDVGHEKAVKNHTPKLATDQYDTTSRTKNKFFNTKWFVFSSK